MDQLVEVFWHLSPKGIRLHLCYHVWWCRICERWMASVLSLLSARGIAAFWSFLVPSFGAGTLLLLPMIVGSCVPLAQMFFQVVILLNKAFYNCSVSLYLPFEGSSAWFISLVVVICHQANEYHTTLCLGSGSMSSTTVLFFPTDGAN